MEESAAKRIRPTVSAGGAPATQWWLIVCSFSGMTVEECLSPSLFTCQDSKLALPRCHSQAFRFIIWQRPFVGTVITWSWPEFMFSIFIQSRSWKMSECDKIIARYPENVFLCSQRCCIIRGYIVTNMVIFAADSRIHHRVVLFRGGFNNRGVTVYVCHCLIYKITFYCISDL